MTQSPPKLFILCGKIASGKSTLAAKLAEASGGVRIVEDEWLHGLYANELHGLDDYVRCTNLLRAALTGHIVQLLNLGVSVVLDFSANTPTQRAWFRELIDQTGAAHELHWLDVPVEVCRDRLAARNASGSHPFQVSPELFTKVTNAFRPPHADEGFIIVRHDVSSLDGSAPFPTDAQG
ncbi:AAA family ATPase [Shimia ponticola]|uniref:AAA family ATPase n=1 Tax=Shimia ponticola TaxID=2582893 RepID=UPI0011BF4E0B|nr:ATP-binding protein [Shimia ponticola]